MLVRSHTATDGSPGTTLIVAHLRHAVPTIRTDVHRILQDHQETSATYVDITGTAQHITELDPPTLFGPKRDNLTVNTTTTPHVSPLLPRLLITAFGATWEDAPSGHLRNFNGFHHTWIVAPCPPHLDADIHELAETLLCDAHDSNEPLTPQQALEVAQALAYDYQAHRGTGQPGRRA